MYKHMKGKQMQNVQDCITTMLKNEALCAECTVVLTASAVQHILTVCTVVL